MHLITGATGLVGSHIAVELIRRSMPVRLILRDVQQTEDLDRLLDLYKVPVTGPLERTACDILDPIGLEEAMEGVRTVYHAAAHISFDPRDEGQLMEVNATGTGNVINAALRAGVERFCHVSSIASLGPSPGGAPVNEDTPWDNDADLSDYARSKYEAELEVFRGMAEGLWATIVCPSVIIGPGRKGRSTRTMLDRVAGGSLFHPPGSTHVVDVRDVAELCVRLTTEGEPGERFVLAGPQVTYKELFHRIAIEAGVTPSRFELKGWMLALAWRVDRMRGLFTGSRSLITRHTADTAMRHRRFDDSKVRQRTCVTLRSLEDMVNNAMSLQ